MENKPLSCPFCGSTKILTDIRHQIASFPTPKAIIRINWCTCYECGASSSLDAWQKRALSERHQRLVGLLSDIKGDLGSAEWGTPEHGEEILMGLIDKYYPKIKAALEEEG